MLRLDGKEFELWFVDTGVLSEMLKNRRGEMRSYLRRSLDNDAIMSISIWTVLELRRRPDLYDRFVEWFSFVPCVMLKSPCDLFEDELAAYPTPSGVSPVLFAFSMFNDPEDQLPAFMARLFSHPEVRRAEYGWREAWCDDVLKSMLKLRENFEPNKDSYTADDASRFVEMGVPLHVMSREFSWAEKRVRAGDSVSADAFPSLKMMFYTAFFRLYGTQRRAERQDVFDIVLSGVIPYVDRVLTERFQAEICRKIQRRDAMLRGIVLETVRHLR